MKNIFSKIIINRKINGEIASLSLAKTCLYGRHAAFKINNEIASLSLAKTASTAGPRHILSVIADFFSSLLSLRGIRFQRTTKQSRSFVFHLPLTPFVIASEARQSRFSVFHLQLTCPPVPLRHPWKRRETYNLKLVLKLAVLFCLILPLTTYRLPLAYASGGRPGEIFMYGAGARPFGMGKAFTAVADDASLAYWNTAGVCQLTEPQVTASYSQLLEEVNYNFIGFTYPMLNRGGLVADVVTLSVPGIDQRDIYNEVIPGALTYSELGGEVGYGRSISQKIMVGFSTQFLSRSMGGAGSSLMGVNASALIGMYKSTKFGLKAENIFSFSQGDTMDVAPLNVRFGGAQKMWKDKLTVALDMEPMVSKWYMGLEMNFTPFFFRLGMNTLEKTAGFGVEIKNKYRLDYALLYQDLGFFNTATFSMKFGSDITKVRLKKSIEFTKKAGRFYADGQYVKALGSLNEGFKYYETQDGLTKYKKIVDLMEQDGLKDFPKFNLSVLQQAQRDAIKFYLDNNMVDAFKSSRAALDKDPNQDLMKKIEGISKSAGGDVPVKLTNKEMIASKLRDILKYFKEKKFDEAMKVCKEVLILDEKNEMAHIRLGSIYYELGMEDSAKEEWSRALEINPQNKDLKKYLEKMK